MASQSQALWPMKNWKQLFSVDLKEVLMGLDLDPKYASTILSPVNYQVFHKVADSRKISLKDLWDLGPSKEAISESVRQLSKAGLIGEVPSSLEDFSTYYVTADGLTAERQMRRLDPNLLSSLVR
jgi:predicted MarR family transcription regulator